MAGVILTVAELRDYLGADEENDQEIESLRTSAIEDICRSTGIDWTKRENTGVFNNALRTQVYLGYYAVRDAAKNTQFIAEYYASAITSLQLCAHEEDA